MKEATGELNMTVVTLIAVTAVAALFYFFLWPMVQRMVANQTCSTYGVDWRAFRDGEDVQTGSQATVNMWMCCPTNNGNPIANRCVRIDDQTNQGGNQGGQGGQENQQGQ